MPMVLTPLTELEAVNEILRNDGEAPVASLDESGFSEAADAYSKLTHATRQHQSKGWAYNTDYERKFTPDVSNEIILPSNTLWINPTYASQSLSIIERGRKLYDLQNNTYEFSAPVYLDICQMLQFTEMPTAMRDYVTIVAARKYQAQSTGSGAQDAFTQEDEWRARAVMKQADSRARPRGFQRTRQGQRFNIRRPM